MGGTEPTIPSELTPQEAAVIGIMRRGEKERKAVTNYALTFSTPDSTTDL